MSRHGDGLMKRILIVDDDYDICEALQLLLERRFEVSVAYNGQQALECLECQSFDAVVLDLMMPVMDGVTALPLLKQACPDARVFVLTATASQVDAAEIERLGAERVLDKSAPLSEVTAALVAA